MADYIRRIVSGNKARFKDAKLHVELDLIYLTDQVIIMGYPATGLEGIYRNRREDAKRFLEARHGKNYWVFNFCPIKENSYPASFFDGRVTRFPFPDHHAPPLAIMPLVAREIGAWLDGSPDRVAVLHCKAGKGRSGTMACSYLLSLDEDVSPPKLERSYTGKEWAKIKADKMLTSIPDNIEEIANPAIGTVSTDPPESQTAADDVPGILVQDFASDPTTTTDSPKEISRTTTPDSTLPPVSRAPTKSFTESLKGVLDLHTSRRMKASSLNGGKVSQGVSIPSQRRWLYYWALLLAHEAPSHLWASPPPSSASGTSIDDVVKLKKNGPKVRLTEIKLQMKEPSGIKMNLVRAANAVIDRTSMAKAPAETNGQAHVWVSLARYDDGYVEMLERWERFTRDDEGNMGKRKEGTVHFGAQSLNEEFRDGKWDSGKMVRSFARMGAIDKKNTVKGESEKHGKTVTYSLTPLSNANWNEMRHAIQQERDPAPDPESGDEPEQMPVSETNSMYDVTRSSKDTGIVLDACREVRIKLYMGQVFMGWLWLVPTFHMPQPPPTSSLSTSESTAVTKVLLTRKELDFPLGLGSSIIDVEISFEWLQAPDSAIMQPVAATPEVEAQIGGEPQAGGKLLDAMTTGTVEDAIRAAQATRE